MASPVNNNQANKPPSMYVMMYQFAKYSSDHFREAIKEFGVGSSGQLLLSIFFQVNGVADDVRSIEFRYKNYGKYTDMGVGKGMPIGSRRERADFLLKRNQKGQLHKHTRKAKPWYSKTIYRENLALADVLEKYYGLVATNVIREDLPTIIEVKL